MNTLIERAWTDGRTYWRTTSGWQRTLFISGSALFVWMLAHGVALALSDRPLLGPISFRKAMTFAESGWLLCWAVGWLLPLLHLQRWERSVIAGATWLFGVAETLLMSVQVWRAQPSHYNLSTPFNSAMFSLTGVIASVFLIGMLVLLRAAIRERDLAPSLRASIRAGTGLVLIGVATGMLMIFNSSGIWQGWSRFASELLDLRVRNGVVGGDIVALHAIGVHGLSLVPLAAWLLTYSPLAERDRHRLTVAVAGSICILLALLALPVFRATPFAAIDRLSAILIVLAALAVVGCYALVGWWVLHGLRQSVRVAHGIN